jgi:hypothetical protein
MLSVKFRTIEQLLDYLPEHELKLTESLRQLVFDCIPHVEEKLSYSIPSYRKHRSICFIWPGCIYWGDKRTYNGVRFGFSYGNLLTDPESLLERGSRKQVFWKDFSKIEDVPFDQLRQLLYEAAMVDEARAWKG